MNVPSRIVQHIAATAAAALLLSIALAGCKSKPKEQPVAAASDPNEVAVTGEIAKNLRFGTPEFSDLHGTLQVSARVETDARNIARVGSPVSGRITKLLVFEGQSVRAGTALAILHTTDLSDTQFSFIKATSQRNLAATAVTRADQLLKADVIGQAELERRRAELVQATTEAASYRTQLRGLGMGEEQIRQLEATGKLSADYPILAPKSGTVLKREVTIGQVVQPADQAFTIADLSSVWIVANVPEEEAGQLQKGLQVQVRIPALENRQISGRLSFVSPIVNPETRTVEVRMDLNNAHGELKPDELATMILTGATERKLTVPSTAVVRESNKDYVFLQAAPEKYVLHEVTLGEEHEDRRIVLSGLNATDRIVTEGAFHLNNQRKQNAIKGAE